MIMDYKNKNGDLPQVLEKLKNLLALIKSKIGHSIISFSTFIDLIWFFI